MKRVGLWWVPLLLLAAPLLGWVPLHRDLLDYFAPIRAHTAAWLAAGEVPWLNLANGCGEAWYANPQTGVLYPPHWLYLFLPLSWGLSLEVALHLAVLSLGVGLLAARWGADGWGRTVAEAAVWSAGPVLATVGVLNNLEALAWLPWMVLAAGHEGRGVVFLTAPAVAVGWLAGEPQVWGIGVALAVAGARHRLAAAAGVALGVGLVAVQLVPFLVWVAEGDRGPDLASAALAGALPAAGWWGLVLPGAPLLASHGTAYAESLLLGPALLACSLIALAQRRWVGLPILALALLATVPEVGGEHLYLAVTQGMVRYPARFALVAVTCLLPLAGVGVTRWRNGAGAGVAMVVATSTLVACLSVWSRSAWLVAGLPAALLLVATLRPGWPWLRDGALVVGIAANLLAGLPLLGLERAELVVDPAPVWPEARAGGRLYTVPATPEVTRWLASDLGHRRLWEVGYLNLTDGVESARTWGPLGHRRLAEHLGQVDQGPGARWWLDTLAAGWVVLRQGEALPGLEAVRRQGDLWLHRNLAALPEITLAELPPDEKRPWRGTGAAVTLTRSCNRVVAGMACSRPACAWISLTPLAGWSWSLDGQPVRPAQGPGIVQFLAVPAGVHRLVGSYRPPGLGSAGLVTVISLAVLAVLVGADRLRGRAP